MAMLMIPSKVSSHVRFLLMEFNDSDYHSLAQEICEFFDYGVETSICVLKTCFTFWKGGHTNTLQLENVVSLVLKRVLEMPNFATLLSCALQDFEVTPEFVTAFHSDASTSEHLDSFIHLLSSHHSTDKLQFVHNPFPSVELHEADVFRSLDLNSLDAILTETAKETSVGDLIEELEAAISRILVLVVRTYAGLKDDYDTFLTFSLSLGCCTPTKLPTPKSWNVDILFETIKLLAPGTTWPRVIENLDHEGFDIPNMEAFLFFMMVVRNICKDPFPLHAVCSFVWKNMEGQLSFLKHAVLAPPEIFTFVHSTRKLLSIDNMHIDEQTALSNHAWRSLDLLDVLCQLAESGHAVSVRSLLQYPLAHCPRTLLLGMAHIETACNIIQREVVSDVLPLMIKNTQDIGFVLNLWQLNRELVIWGLLDAQNLGLDSMLRIIDIFHELKILSSVINSVPLSLGIKLAILASQRGFLEIESWLSKCLFLYKDVFFEECLKVIKDIHFQKSKDIFSKQFRSADLMSDLCLDATSFLLNALKPHITSRQLFEELEKVHEAVLNIGTFVAATERKENPIEAPPSEVQDKMYFIMNNVSAANVESKGKEFSEILSIQYYPWFAQYMVMKRVSTEQQFHDLYLKFLDKVNSQQLYKEIVQASYENCKVLLGSALIKSDSEERSLLKNLGSWLGKVTIGRNRVLRACEIDPKSLIIDAYEKGLLIAILPFTAKVLESCQSSIAYQPPNPWTMPILGLLSEIYSMPNLKMNLKFEIEIFFKNIGVNIKSVKPTSLLKNRKREIDGNPDFRNKDFGVAQGSQPQMIDEFKSENISPQNHVELPTNAGVHSKLLPQATMLFAEWCQICSHPGENDASRTRHVLHLYQSGLLKGDDKTESFFRILTEYSIAHCISSGEMNSGALQSTQEVQEPSFVAIDIYAKLVFSILNYFREQESSCKSFLLSKIVTVIVRSILKDADDEKTPLYPRPYFRLFINLLLDLSSRDHITDSENYQAYRSCYIYNEEAEGRHALFSNNTVPLRTSYCLLLR
uniref:CCR4-Not complex component Not1 C-terminal domain-containing protein n=1 Tax=Brassica oleracea var. oleracea TaxID=109376 RepID=A0A0D3DZJ6_BRAOL